MWSRFDAYFEGVAFEPWSNAVFQLFFYLLLAVDTFAVAWGSPLLRNDSLELTKLPLELENAIGRPDVWTRITLLTCTSIFAVFSALHCGTDTRRFCQYLTAVGFNAYYWLTAIDGFQHHYLLCVVLVLVPLSTVHPWARRLLCMQVGLLYIWTAVAKIDGSLGKILPVICRLPMVHKWVANAAWLTGSTSDAWVWSAMGWGVVLTEVSVALLLLRPNFNQPRSRILVMFLGMSLHVGFEKLASLSIGFFSFYMISFFVLLAPSPYQKWE